MASLRDADVQWKHNIYIDLKERSISMTLILQEIAENDFVGCVENLFMKRRAQGSKGQVRDAVARSD